MAVLVLLLALVQGSVTLNNPYSDEIVEIFQKLAKQNELDVDPTAAVNTCTMSSSENCPMSAMPVNETTLVYPGGFMGGGETGCISGSEFAFQVIPRNPNKVHFYFQGGGACWDRVSTWLHFCSQNASPVNGNSGVFDSTNPLNPYADYTVVAVLYCSGDVHIGNVTQNWETEPESELPARQVGYINSMSALEWITQQGVDTLDNLLISGSSAGALGTQASAEFIPTYLPAKQVSVIIDSYVGVFDCLGPLLERYGTCEVPLATTQPQYLIQKCKAKNLQLSDWIPNQLLADPTTQWGFLQSKSDATQQTFYAAVAALCLDNPVVTPYDFYAWTNLLLEAYAPYPNFNVFFVDAAHHVYLTNSDLYTASTKGLKDAGGPTMIDFVQSLQTGSVSSQCDGIPLSRLEFEGTDYCDSGYLPRSTSAAAPKVTKLFA